RCFSYDSALAKRRFMYPRDARGFGGCRTRSKADRLYQCARELDAAERQRRNDVDQKGVRRPSKADPSEWDERLLRASAGSDRGDRGSHLRAGVRSTMDSTDDQLSKSRSGVRSRRRTESWTRRGAELRHEQFIRLRWNQRLRNSRTGQVGTALWRPDVGTRCPYLSKSGRFSRVRLIACSLRHFAISA